MNRQMGDVGALKVLYVGVEDMSYPRNRRIREFLADWGVSSEVIISRVDRHRLWRSASLFRQFFQHLRGYDLVILAEFSNSLFWYSWLLAKLNGASHVVDFFIGKYETLVEDAGRFSSRSVAGKLLRLIDVATLKSADYVLTDTELRARNFARLTETSARFRSLPVGSPFSAGKSNDFEIEGESPTGLYYGYYSQLHGVPEIAHALVSARAVVDFKAIMIGDGDTRSETEDIVRQAGLSNFTFIDSIPQDDLFERIERASFVFGVFGASPKARSVIANKVWQGLYAGKIVITGESEALDEIAYLVGEQLIQVPVGDRAQLADAVVRAVEAANAVRGSVYSGSAGALERYVNDRFAKVFAEILDIPVRGRE